MSSIRVDNPPLEDMKGIEDMETQPTLELEEPVSRLIVLEKYGLDIMKPISITNYPENASVEKLSEWVNMTLRTLIGHEYPINDSLLRRQILQSAWSKAPGEMNSGFLRLHRTISLELAKLLRENSIIQTDDRFYIPSSAAYPFSVIRGKQANEISVMELMTVLNALYYHNPDTCRAVLFDESKSLYGMDCSNHLPDANLGIAHSLLLHNGLVEENFDTSTCACVGYGNSPTRFLLSLPHILHSNTAVSTQKNHPGEQVVENSPDNVSESDSIDESDPEQAELVTENDAAETAGMQNDDETGYGFVFTDPIDSGLIPMRDSSQIRADWVVENVVELVREEFPLQYGLLRSQLSKPMLDDGAPKENIDDYLYWAIRFAKTKIAYRGGFLFPLDISDREYRIVRGRTIDQICIPEIALVMHRIAARQPQTNRSILFDRTAEVFDIPNESVEVSAALEKALGLLIRTGRILKNNDAITNPVEEIS